MKAKKKPIQLLKPADIGLSADTLKKPRVETLKVEEPPKRQGGKKVADVDELLAKLKNEAGVL